FLLLVTLHSLLLLIHLPMNDHLQSEFILSAKKSLEDLARDMRRLREARGRERRELIENIFRHTHTIKGTASAAGFEPAAHLAHEIENLLDSIRLGRVRLNEESVGALREATVALAENLESAARGETLRAPAAVVERLRRLAVGSDEETPAFSEKILSLLPYEIAGALNAYEKHRLGAAAEDGLNLFVLAFGLPLATFDEKFRLLSDALSARGEIISTLPGVEDAEPEKISFRVLYATEADAAAVVALAESVVAVTLTELKLMRTDEEFSESSSEERASAHFITQSSDSEKLYETVAVSRLLERARRAGEMAARAAGKEIEF